MPWNIRSTVFSSHLKTFEQHHGTWSVDHRPFIITNTYHYAIKLTHHWHLGKWRKHTGETAKGNLYYRAIYKMFPTLIKLGGCRMQHELVSNERYWAVTGREGEQHCTLPVLCSAPTRRHTRGIRTLTLLTALTAQKSSGALRLCLHRVHFVL